MSGAGPQPCARAPGEPLRVLMTADTLGGVWSYALELARTLAGAHVEIALATLGAPLSASQHVEIAGLRHVTLFESHYALEWMENPWAEVDAAGAWLLELARQFAPQIIHLNGYAHATLPWPAPVIVVAHSCVLSWWQAVKGGPAPDCYAEYRRRVSRGLAAAHLLVAPSAAMLEALACHYPLGASTCVIPNGRDRRFFRVRRKQPQIFSSGRLWDEAKNVRLLQTIAPHLLWPVSVAGDAGRGLDAPAAGRTVEHLGRLSPAAIARRLSRAAIYAAPARYEPFGLGILEAALCGCALVLGDIPSLRENWAGSAIFVPSGDAAAWCGVLNMLAMDEKTRREFGRRARVRALRLSPARMAAAYLHAYARVRGLTHAHPAEFSRL